MTYPEIITSPVQFDEEIPTKEPQPIKRLRSRKVSSTASFSVYPCVKCHKDLQHCDLLLPKCTRCLANNFECDYKETEPKANHVSQVLITMNKVIDYWQESIDKKARDYALRARTFAANKAKIKQPTTFKITTTKRGLSIESNVNSYNGLFTLVDQFKQFISISNSNNMNNKDIKSTFSSLFQQKKEKGVHLLDDDFDENASSFAVWNLWASSTHVLPQNYPIDINDELTDNLIDLYCRTPCCSSIRIPILDTTEFLARYQHPDRTKRPSKVLIYAICAMAARNAFQLHIWGKRPTSDCPQYNMGKALSVAYCLRGRELLSECFDEPSFDHCQAAFLLSYCHYQNGYPGVIYFYEWIAYSMASDLGLYSNQRALTKEESMLIWCIYYYNVWYRTLKGADSANAGGLSQCKPPLETMPKVTQGGEDKVEHYVWNSWVYLIQLQVLRDQTMAVLSNHDEEERLPETLIEMQKQLDAFCDSLPTEWKTDQSYSSFSSTLTVKNENEPFKTNIQPFARYCVQLVQIHYYINQILLYEPFVPMYDTPRTELSIQSLETIVGAAHRISDLIEQMIQVKENCHIPLVSFLFSNVVYKKLMTYHDHYYEIGKLGLLRSLDISKSSITYIYDFELARTLVNIMELDIQSSVQNTPTCVPSPTSYGRMYFGKWFSFCYFGLVF